MTTFVLRTEDGDDLGYLMFADHDADWPPAGQNDCMLTGFPFDPALLDNPGWEFIAAHKNEEFSADVSYTQTTMTVAFQTNDGWRFILTSNEADGSQWTATRGDASVTGTGDFI